MLFFIVLGITILLCFLIGPVMNFNDDIGFCVVVGAMLTGVACGIIGLITLGTIGEDSVDVAKMEKLKVEIMSLNAVEDKNPGVIILINDKVNTYNNIKEDGISQRNFLMMNTTKYCNVPSLVYDYDTNTVYEVK